MELRSADDVMRTGPVIEWICSGVPTELTVPDREETIDLLGARGLLLFPDGPAVRGARNRCRRPIGHVTCDPDVLRLAVLLAEDAAGQAADPEQTHVMVLAARWVEAGFSVDAAAGWATAGVVGPTAAQSLMSAELTPVGDISGRLFSG